MSLKEFKITTYEDNVSDLPDNPSAAGYTAARLKAIFDGRGDKEIKEKHNGLIDALVSVFEEYVKVAAFNLAYGVQLAEDGSVKVVKATDEQIEAATNMYRPIVPGNLQKAVTSIGDNLYADKDAVGEAKEYAEELIDALEAKVYNRTAIDDMLRNLKLSGGGDGVAVISVHDEACDTLVPEDGAMYIIKYHDMPYGEDPSLISDKVFYRIKIGDGVSTLADLPVVSNIQAGNGTGSIVLVDPTYDNGDDGLDAPNNTAEGQYGVSLGKYLTNKGKAAAAFNYSNEITENGKRSFVANMRNLVDAARAFASGYQNTVKGIGGGIYGGANNTIEANAENPANSHNGTILGGNGNKLLGNALRTILAGYCLVSDTADQVVLGQYNAEDADALLIVGCGTGEDDRRNALVVKQDGSLVINDEKYIADIMKEAANGTLKPLEMCVDEEGKPYFTEKDGEISLAGHLKFTKNGHSDVTSSNMENYTEYPEEGSESDRMWVYLGSAAPSSYSNGMFSSVTSTYSQNTILGENVWTAFKMKGDALGEGVHSVVLDYVVTATHYADIEVFMLPMTDEMQVEFASDNTETYGSLYTDKACTTPYDEETYTSGYLYRSGAKLFNKLTSIAGAKPIGMFNINTETAGAVSVGDEAFDLKLGAIEVTAEDVGKEWLILFRNASGGNATTKLVSLGFVKFEPTAETSTDSIKIGDTTVTEEQMKAMMASSGVVDMSGYVTTEDLSEAISGAIGGSY